MTIYGRRFAVTLCRCTEVGAQWGTDYQKGGRVKSLQSRLLLRYRLMVLQTMLAYSYLFYLFILSPPDFIISLIFIFQLC